MQYRNFTSRPGTRIHLEDGTSREVKVQRLMATLSADRPLGPRDYACHCCDHPWCCNPDHLRADPPSSNMRDKFGQRRIRQRRSARFYDEILLEIAAVPPIVLDRLTTHSRSIMPAKPMGWAAEGPETIEGIKTREVLPFLAAA